MNDIFDNIKAQFKRGGMYIKLLYVNVAVFAVMIILKVFSGLFADPDFINSITGFLGVSSDLKTLLVTPWTLISYMFVHAMDNLFHIVFNMLMLFFVGSILEQYLGGKKILAIYMLGGLAGVLLEVFAFNVFPVFSAYPDIVIVGASGSVFALSAALATYNPNLEVRLFGVVPMKLVWLIGGYFVLEFLRLGSSDGVAHFTHLGGGLFGFIMASQYKKGKDITKWFDNLVGYFSRFNLSRRPKMKVEYSKYRGSNQNNPPKDDYDFNAEKADDQKRLDAILDKIKYKGYEGLTAKEKEFLNKF